MAKPKPINPKILELQADIEVLNAVINDPDIPEEDKTEPRESVLELEAQIVILQKPKVDKPKKEKPAKPEIKLGDRSFKEVSSQELEEAFGKRLVRVGELGGKSKTKSIFSSNGNAQSNATA